MERVAVGRTAARFDQTVGVRSRQEWYRYKMSREQLVGISGQRCRQMVAGRCWLRGRGSGGVGGADSRRHRLHGGGKPTGSGGQWSKQ